MYQEERRAIFEQHKDTTLILTETDPKRDTMYQSWIRRGLHADLIFGPTVKAWKLIRRGWMDLPFPAYGSWLGDWKQHLDTYDTIILHASELTRNIPSYIFQKKPDMRIIYWYWNPVNEKSNPKRLPNDIKRRIREDIQGKAHEGFELWSFDQGDCQKYAMKENIQYYDISSVMDAEPEYDIYFIGHDKGRKEEVRKLQKQTEKMGLTSRIDLIGADSSFIPYKEVQKRIAKSRAILEINQNGQSGMTLRTLEALFFGKKLITSNEEIRNVPFYRKSNIFLLNRDTMEGLADFVRSPYDHSVDCYRSDYDLEAWFTNFFVTKNSTCNLT